MTLEELKALIEKATAHFEAQKKENETLTVAMKAQEEKFIQLKGDFDKLKEGGDQDEAKKMAKDLEDLANEISDLRSKHKEPITVVTQEQKQAIHDAVLKPVIGEWLKGKKNNTSPELFKFIEQQGVERFKTLNITNADEGGRAVAEYLFERKEFGHEA